MPIDLWDYLDVADPLEVGTLICTSGIFLAALLQYRLTHKSSKRQLRAYVTLANPLLRVTQKEGGSRFDFYVRFEIKNHGLTPAYNLTTPAHIELLAAESDHTFATPKADRRLVGSILGPNEAVVVERHIEVDAESYTRFYSGEMQIYLIGRANYKDAFGGRRFFQFTSKSSHKVRSDQTGPSSFADFFSFSPALRGYQGN